MAIDTLSSSQIINPLEGRKVVVATGKEEAFRQFVAILSEYLQAVVAYNPETLELYGLQISTNQESQPENYQEEPAQDNPAETVQWKLERRLHELVQTHLQELKDYLVIASDVGFRVDGQSQHRLSRAGELDEQLAKAELLQRYQEPFTAEWQVAFGMAENNQVSTTLITISATYPGLTEAEINDSFDPNTNPGLHLVELGQRKGVAFSLTFPGTDPVICDNPETKSLVTQFIIKKVPTFEMIQRLYEACITQQPDQLGLLAQALQNSTTNLD